MEDIGTIQLIDINKITPHKLNKKIFKDLDGTEFESLKLSLTQYGFITPLIVAEQQKDEQFILLCGHQRYRAAKELNIQYVPCIIKEFKSENEMLEVLIEDNLERRQLNYLEKAIAIREYYNVKKSAKAVIGTNGITKAQYYESMGLLKNLDERLCNYIVESKEDVPVTLLRKIAFLPKETQEIIANILDVKGLNDIQNTLKDLYSENTAQLKKRLKIVEQKNETAQLENAELKNKIQKLEDERMTAVNRQPHATYLDELVRKIIQINTLVLNLMQFMASHDIDPESIGLHDFDGDIKQFAKLDNNVLPPVAPIFRTINVVAILKAIKTTNETTKTEYIEALEKYLLEVLS